VAGRSRILPVPTDLETLPVTLTEWELSDLRQLHEELQDRSLVPLAMTLNRLVLRLAQRRAEEIRAALAAGLTDQAAELLK